MSSATESASPTALKNSHASHESPVQVNAFVETAAPTAVTPGSRCWTQLDDDSAHMIMLFLDVLPLEIAGRLVRRVYLKSVQ